MAEQYAGGSIGKRTQAPTGLALLIYRMRESLSTPKPYLMFLGVFLWLFTYWLLCEGLKLDRFDKIPGPIAIAKEWFSFEPFQGISFFTAEFYDHILVSCRRIAIAFAIATGVGVPLGLFMGWSERIRQYIFPILETLRPIPPLAWVPLAILMFPGFEAPVIFLATLASLLSLIHI